MKKLQVVLVFDIKPRHGGSPRWDIQRRVDGARGETKGEGLKGRRVHKQLILGVAKTQVHNG